MKPNLHKSMNSARIEIKEQEKELIVYINGRVPKWQEYSLMVWLTFWTCCGGYVIYSLFEDFYDKDTKLAFFIYLCFWAYFEYKGIHAYLWRLYGKEMIKITEETLYYKKDIRSYGKLKTYIIDNIKLVETIDYSGQKFVQSYSNAFWTISGPTLFFSYIGKQITFAFQLEQADIEMLNKKLNYWIRKTA